MFRGRKKEVDKSPIISLLEKKLGSVKRRKKGEGKVQFVPQYDIMASTY